MKAAQRVWLNSMRMSSGLTVTVTRAQVEFRTAGEADRFKREGWLREGAEFSWVPGLAPLNAVSEGRVVKVDLHITPGMIHR